MCYPATGHAWISKKRLILILKAREVGHTLGELILITTIRFTINYYICKSLCRENSF